MKQFVFLLAACVCPPGFLSAVSADESQPIVLTTDEIVQKEEKTASSANTDDVSVESETSITATVNETEDSLDEIDVDGADFCRRPVLNEDGHNPLDRFARERRHILAEIDRQIGFAVGLV